MSYELIKSFEHRGFTCEITQVTSEEPSETPYYDFCIVKFVKPTTLDKILFFGIGEGIRSDAIAALIDFVGLTSFYPGDFNKDVEDIMKIGALKHEEHIACYTTDQEGDHWKYMTPSEMEDLLKMDIDNYHNARKRLIMGMKLYRGMAERMRTMIEQAGDGQTILPSVGVAQGNIPKP